MYELIEKIYNSIFRNSKGICGGFKAIGTVSAEIVLTKASFIQNRGADDQALVYEDEEGNSGSILMKQNEITPALIAKIKTGSGASMYQITPK